MKKGQLYNFFVERESVFGLLKAFMAVLFSLAVVSVILLATGYKPLPVFGSLLSGAFGSPRRVGESLVSTTPLIFSSLGFLVAYRWGLSTSAWKGRHRGRNRAAFFGYALPTMPPILHVTICILAGALAGGFWGFIPGYLKAKFGVHEVIGVIMLNNIAFKIAAYLVSMNGPMKDRVDAMPASPFIKESARIVRIIPGTRLHWGIFLAIATAFVLSIYLFKTRSGFKIRAVGKNRYAAEALGISVQKNIVLALALSGALGGIAGAVEILGVHYRLFAAFRPAMLRRYRRGPPGHGPSIGVLASAYLFGIREAAHPHAGNLRVNKDKVSVITGVIVLFMGMSAPLGFS